MHPGGEQRVRRIGILVLANSLLALAAVLRELLLAINWGTSPVAGAYLLAMYIPDFLGNLLVSTALHTAAVPYLALAAHRSELDMNLACRRLIYQVMPVMTVLTLMCASLGGFLVRQVGPGLPPELQHQARLFLWLMLPGMLLYPLYGLMGARHFVHGTFWRPAFGPVLLNVGVAAGLWGAARSGHAELMAIGYAAGVVAMCALQVGPWLWVPGRLQQEVSPAVVYRAFLPLGGAVMVTQLAAGFERAVASRLDVECVAALNYAVKVVNFPLWIFVTAVSAVTFTRLSWQAANGETQGAARDTWTALRLVLFVCMPFAVAMFILRGQVLSVVFGYGAFDHRAASLSAQILAGYALYVPAGAAIFILSRSFQARGRVDLTLKAAVFGAVTMVLVLAGFAMRWGPITLGMAMAAGSFAHASALFVYARPFLGTTWARILGSCLRLSLATVPVALVASIAVWVAGPRWLEATLAWRISAACLMALLVVVAYAAGCRVAKVEVPGEISELLSLVLGPVRRRLPLDPAGRESADQATTMTGPE